MIEKHQAAFNATLHAISRQAKFPVRAMFEVTYRCNFRCQHCYLPEKHLSGNAGRELTFEQICSLLESLRELGVFYLGFTGGEVFVRRDMIAILEFAKRQGFQVMVNTNGFFIDEKLADQLSKLELNKVDISVHSLNAESYAGFTGVSLAKERILRAIRLLHERKVPLGLKTNIMLFNREEIREIQQLAADVGAFHRMDGEMHPRWDGDIAPYEFALEPDEIRDVVIGLSKEKQLSMKPASPFMPQQPAIAHSGKLAKGRASLFTCGVASTGVAITPDGALKPCLQLQSPRFSIAEFGVAGAWKQIQSYFENFKPDDTYECGTCEFASECKWCPAISHMETGTLTSCTRRVKYRAQQRCQNAGEVLGKK